MAKSKKASFKDYMDTTARIKPSAEVKFASVQEDGSVDEVSSRKQFWESMTSDEVQTVNEEFENAVMESMNQVKKDKKSPSTGDLVSKINSIAKERPEPIKKELKEVVEEVKEAVTEATTMRRVAPEEMEIADPLEVGPVSGNFEELEDEFEDERDRRPEVASDVMLILQTLELLIDKIDNMQNFTPIIHVPAPVIHVTLPETTRTVTKAVERDGEGYIKTVRETIEEKPQGEPLIEVIKSQEPDEPEDIIFEEDK